MNDFKRWVILLALVALMIGASMLLTSCAAQYRPDGSTTKEIVRLKTIYKTNWLASVFILTIVLGVFAALNGFKLGISAAIAAGGGLYCLSAYQTFASHPYWPLVLAIAGMVAGISFAVYSLFIKDKGFAVLKGK